MEKQLTLLVGPSGSGKTTFARGMVEGDGYTYINQDSQGKGHMQLFEVAVVAGENIVVDRMGFSKEQRSRYLSVAKKYGYETEIVVLHESYETCFKRCLARRDHETIKDETNARAALNMFFSKYERVSDDEADTVRRIWPEGDKPSAIICDLDGTLCNVEHRRHFVNQPKGVKKDWGGFFKAMVDDTPNQWCVDLLKRMSYGRAHTVVFCSGRPDSYRRETKDWLEQYGMTNLHTDFYLYMRHRQDQRQDDIVKEIILDFELLTRFTPFFMIDDRDQVVKMWRKRGYTCLQCAPGDF